MSAERNSTMSTHKVIFSVPMCQYLLREGFNIIDVKFSNKNNGKVVFVFRQSDRLQSAINRYIDQPI